VLLLKRHAKKRRAGMISGTLKSGEAGLSEITLMKDTGAEPVLELGTEAKVIAGESGTPNASLAGHIGRSVEVVAYGAGTRGVVPAGAAMRAHGNVSSVVGVLDMVGVLSGMVALLTETEGALVLKITPETTIVVNNTVSVLAELGPYVGKPLAVEFDAESYAAIAILVD
jgi:hypothetical protein